MTNTLRPQAGRAGLAALVPLALALAPAAHAETNIGDAIAHTTTMPASMFGAEMTKAEALRRLDIMLMVTGLRCRTGASDFQADFATFEAHHIAELNQAARELRERLVRENGTARGNAMIDQVSVAMANQYGNGHPWLGCEDLKSVTQNLAAAEGEAPLLAAAGDLLGDAAPMHMAEASVPVAAVAVADVPAAPVPTTAVAYAPPPPYPAYAAYPAYPAYYGYYGRRGWWGR